LGIVVDDPRDLEEETLGAGNGLGLVPPIRKAPRQRLPLAGADVALEDQARRARRRLVQRGGCRDLDRALAETEARGEGKEEDEVRGRAGGRGGWKRARTGKPHRPRSRQALVPMRSISERVSRSTLSAISSVPLCAVTRPAQ